MSKDRNKGVAAGVAIGAVVGVITGILFAPKSGKETRKDIKDGVSRAAEKFEKQARLLQAELSDLIRKVETQFKDKKGAVNDKAKELIEQAKKAQTQLRVLAKSVKAGEADDKDLDKAIKKAQEAKDSLAKYLKK